MDEVKVIGLELASTNDVTFPSLKILRFEDMSSWEVWSTNREVMFPCLQELEIKKCPKLIDVSLKALDSLRVLTIDNCSEIVLRNLVQAASSTTKLEIRSILGLTDEVWRGVIEKFGSVEELSIGYCDEIRYLWESNAEASKVLVNLKELTVWGCKNLVSLGEKEEEDNIESNHLSTFKILDVRFCESMELKHVCLPGATKTGRGGKNIKSLIIRGVDMHMENIKNTSMPMLKTIYITNWENLKSIIQLSESTHLTSLIIRSCQSMESFPNLQLPNLTRLDIIGCKNMKEIRDPQIPNLISWRIENCENLESFPDLQLSNLTMLKDLCIRKCRMIDASFPRGIWPPKLLTLEIGGLKKPISEWGYQNFPTSLVQLTLFGEDDVRNFSQLSHLLPSSLTTLTILDFVDLESLSTGLQHLTSLQHLRIWKCPKLIHLPETLLAPLLSLRMWECQKMEESHPGVAAHTLKLKK
ncbi:hypothetical protein M8C21_032862 [Ambrosia artemisiifolia]|uniref:Disease resistance protein At4g27190-like leucine-rich repeats domain-containing protein n=1 Tax=Ambrosia artemisiifolia TaxID=4212 RepID=A0AAD5CXI7_AMBAR|nr:hypothetical protein M8C21_032862 [Ambrosia artemisiifolia]